MCAVALANDSSNGNNNYSNNLLHQPAPEGTIGDFRRFATFVCCVNFIRLEL
jgi:hypothetical protein